MKEYNKKIFANNLNHYMECTGTKASDICTMLGVGKSTVSSWCNAQKMPRMDKIQMLSDHFKIQKSDLIEDKKNTPSEISTEEMLSEAIKNMLGREPTENELKRFLGITKVFFDIKD